MPLQRRRVSGRDLNEISTFNPESFFARCGRLVGGPTGTGEGAHSVHLVLEAPLSQCTPGQRVALSQLLPDHCHGDGGGGSRQFFVLERRLSAGAFYDNPSEFVDRALEQMLGDVHGRLTEALAPGSARPRGRTALLRRITPPPTDTDRQHAIHALRERFLSTQCDARPDPSPSV